MSRLRRKGPQKKKEDYSQFNGTLTNEKSKEVSNLIVRLAPRHESSS